MGNDIVISENRNLSAIEVQAQVNLIQEVMKQVMKKDIHYGKPFKTSDKQTLLKAGAEKICMTFRIAPDYDIEDLSTSDEIRYRIKCKGVHIPTGMILGCGVGECSSNEEKYKWRASVCDEEFEATPIDKKRIKFKKNYGKVEEIKQIRTEIADIANTILKMCKKRSLVDMTLTTTAASDLFDQDIEDLPEHLIQDNETVQEDMPTEKEEKKKPVKKATDKEPQTKEEVAEKCYLLIGEIISGINSSEEEIVKECSKFPEVDQKTKEKTGKEIFATSVDQLLQRSTDKWLKSTYGKIKKMHENLGLTQ